jgi:hypothetical protein
MVVGRILDRLGVESNLTFRWGKDSAAGDAEMGD